MTQEETLQYNKMCAEFIGWVVNDIPESLGGGKGWFKDNIYQCEVGLEMFDSDWNWIMEIVEAIEKLDSFYVQIEESACYIYDISKFTDEQCNPFISCDLKLNSKKEAVVQAINQFLIWYNKNK